MGNLKLGQSVPSLLQQAVTYLHRMAGAKLHVQNREVKQDDLSLHMGKIVYVRFMNRGEAPVLIDNQILLYSNESYVEGDTAGLGINHSYKIEFQEADEKQTPLGTPVRPFLYAGKHLSIRTFQRKY